MIFFFIKNWKLLLDIILVVAGIIVFTLFDPFGIFSSTKLRGTANLVSSVKSIGELVTAEYYGEVIASLHETKIYDIAPDVIYGDFESCYFGLKNIVASEMQDDEGNKGFLFFKKSSVKKVQDSDLLPTFRDEYSTNQVYTHLIVFLAFNNLGGNYEDYYNVSSKEIKSRKETEKRVLQVIIDDLTQFVKSKETDLNELTAVEVQEFIFNTPSYFSGISDFHYELKEGHQMSRKQRKKDIVFIGRGWVKAGFRFGQFDESNFYYDEDLKLIRFYGLSPTILDKDINPWFIPERKIKGFELVDFYNKATFEEAKMVKRKCKEKLLAQAEKADILAQSKENGEEALKNFFSLLLDEPELTVELVEFPYEQEYQMIAADTLITVDEALRIDKLHQAIKSDTLNLSATELTRNRRIFNMFMHRLMKLAFVDPDVPFSLFSLEAARVLEHTLFITQKDYDTMKQLRDALNLNASGQIVTKYMEENSEFIEGYTSFTADFNRMMKLIDKKLKETDSLRMDTLLIDPIQFERLGLDDTSLAGMSERIIEDDTVYAIKIKDRKIQFADLRYPILKLDPLQFSNLKLADTVRVRPMMEKSINKARFTSGDSSINTIVPNELDQLAKHKSDSIKYSIKVGPVRNFTKRINDLLN